MLVLSLILAVCALLFCVYLYLELQRKLSRTELGEKLKQASEELSKNYGTQYRQIESEWAEMYQKFMRIAGRVDKVAALNQREETPAQPTFLRRSDLLRQRRG